MPQFPTKFHQPAGFSMAWHRCFALRWTTRRAWQVSRKRWWIRRFWFGISKKGRINLQLSKNQVMNADLHDYLNPKGCKNETKSHRTNGSLLKQHSQTKTRQGTLDRSIQISKKQKQLIVEIVLGDDNKSSFILDQPNWIYTSGKLAYQWKMDPLIVQMYFIWG